MRHRLASVPLFLSLVLATTSASAAGAATCGAMGSCSAGEEQQQPQQALTPRGGSSDDMQDGESTQAAKIVEQKEAETTETSETIENTETTEATETSETSENSSSDTESDINSTKSSSKTLTFSLFKENDGSATDPDGIPTRFLLMQKSHRPAALNALQHTLTFRETHQVDTILRRPHPKYNQVKAVFPHYFAGRDVVQNPILVQRLGKIDLKISKKLNVSKDEIVMHYVYILEYCWNILEPSPKGVMTSILDMDGVSWRELQHPEKIGFVKRVVSTISAHYPQRSYKTLIINAPVWFYGVYNIIKPLLRESTKAKIMILKSGKKQDDVLREVLGEGGLPRELLSEYDGDGGVDGAEIGENGFYVSAKTEPGMNSEMEQEIRAFVVDILEKHDMKMLPC